MRGPPLVLLTLTYFRIVAVPVVMGLILLGPDETTPTPPRPSSSRSQPAPTSSTASSPAAGT